MDRLEQARAVAERGRGQEAKRAHEDRGLVAQDVPEHVLGEEHVEGPRVGDQTHSGGIDVQVVEPDIGVVPAHARDRLAPQLGHLEHVRLVDRGDVPPPLPRRLEGHPRDPLNLDHRVAQRVDGRGSAVLPAARLAVVQAARELPHDEYVHALEAIGLER